MTLAGFADVQLVGSGGLGTVYAATRLSTGGRVALKIIEDTSDRTGLVRRVQRELQALLALKGHPHVVSVEELLESDGKPVFVMEFAPGGSLTGYVERVGRQLHIEEIILVGSHISAALVDAHASGIIHRDVKPQNALIGSFGQVKLCDFGIAALKQTDEFRSRTAALSLRYASPEELEGDPDVAYPADVFSLGSTLAHLWTGLEPSVWRRTPMSGGLDAPGVALDYLLRQCQVREPGERPVIAEFAVALSEVSRQIGRRLHRLPDESVRLSAEPQPICVTADSGPTVVRRGAPIDDSTVVRRPAAELPSINDAPDHWWANKE